MQLFSAAHLGLPPNILIHTIQRSADVIYRSFVAIQYVHDSPGWALDKTWNFLNIMIYGDYRCMSVLIHW